MSVTLTVSVRLKTAIEPKPYGLQLLILTLILNCTCATFTRY